MNDQRYRRVEKERYTNIRHNETRPDDNECSITDNLAYVSLAFLTFKILTGAFWIKETWGHYWSWAPRRLEKPSPSLPIWSISTTNKRTHTGCEAHYGF